MAHAFAAEPERFVRGAPKVARLTAAVWINKPANASETLEAAQ